jgi:hypothetical protein
MLVGSATWTDTVTALASMVGAVGLVGVVVQIRQTRLSREAEITMDFSRRWDEELVRNARHCVTHDYASPEALRDALIAMKQAKDNRYGSLLAEPNYYEDLAVMCSRGVLDKRIIRESLGETLHQRWLRWEAAVVWLRETDPQNYVYFERLALEMRDRPARSAEPLDVFAWLGESVVVWPPRRRR